MSASSWFRRTGASSGYETQRTENRLGVLTDLGAVLCLADEASGEKGHAPSVLGEPVPDRVD
jgi:hypothetical protein